MATPVEQIKERLDIVDVISTYIKLEKAGKQYRARCPFHNEKTPSFYVSPERNSFHCFGCNVGGDIFTFVEKIEGLEFKDSLKLLADRAGVTLTAGDKKTDSELFDCLEAATQYFESILDQSPEALQYVHERGISEDTRKLFRIGFAKNDWRQLTGFLLSKGFSEEAIEKAGLSIKSEKGYYDRFRGRVMFPICNTSGKVVGFSGRILPSLVETQPNAGKYVNSPETELYHKSRILFGYDKAKRNITEETGCVIVEGQMDLVMSHQAGTKNTVAVSGTALTVDHLNLIKRFTNKIILSLDADIAGFAAARKSAELALLANMDVRAIQLDGGKDPADMIRGNSQAWTVAVQEAKPIIEYMLGIVRLKYIDDRTFGLQVTQQILPLLAYIQNKIDQAYFVRAIANALKAPEDSVWKQLAKTSVQTNVTEKPKQEAVQTKTRLEKIVEELLGFAEVAQEQNSKIRAVLERLTNKNEVLSTYIEQAKEQVGRHATKVEIEYTNRDKFEEIADELLLNVEEEATKVLLEKLMKEHQQAELEKDIGKANKLLEQCHELSKELQKIKEKRYSHGAPPK